MIPRDSMVMLVNRNAEPSENRSPYKRIDINPRVPVTPAPTEGYYEKEARIAAEAKAKAEADRIWKLVRQSSGDDVEPDEPKPALVEVPVPSVDEVYGVGDYCC
jgi:hypothetical protein